MTPAERRRYFNLCDPEAPVDPEDPRAVDIDHFNSDDVPVRGEVWVDNLVRDITFSEAPRCDLFTGLPGSGKSTLLRRLKRELERPQDESSGGFLCVLVNAERWLDPASPVEVPDILLAIVYEVERAVLSAENEDPDLAARDGVVSRLWSWLSQTDAALQGFEATLATEATIPEVATFSTGAKVVIELKTNPTLRARLREAVAERVYPFLAQVRDYLAELCRRALQRGRDGIVVIVDSLEKLRGIHSNFAEVLESAERIFASGAPYLHLADPVLGSKAPRLHVLYTIPPALVLRRAIHDLRFLPMIKLHDRRGDRYDPGYDAARAIIRQRIPDVHLAQVFGADVLEKRCDALIAWSGGYPRDIVRLLREFVKQSATVDERLFQRLLSTAADAYRRTVTVDALPWLAEVSTHLDLRQTEDSAHRQIIDRALSDNLVLRYKNDTEWFDLHPALRDMPALIEARDALARRDSPPVAKHG